MDPPFGEIAEIYQRIEGLSKRLDMTDALIDLLKGRQPDEMETIVRLTKGEVRPGYEGVEIGVAEKLAVKALYMVTRVPQDEIEERRKILGDIGLVAEEVMKEKKQMSLFSEPLTVRRVFDKLETISKIEGKASQDLKLKHIAELLHDSSPLESKYITRIVCEKMRLGIADMTIVDSLAYIFTPGFNESVENLRSVEDLKISDERLSSIMSRRTSDLYDMIDTLSHPKKNGLSPAPAKAGLEILTRLRELVQKYRERMIRTFNIHPDLGSISRELAEKGMECLDKITVTPGVPLRAMLGERLSSIGGILEKMEGRAALEYKYDGLRVQAHITRDDIRLFSRQLEDITDQFPDVQKYLKRSFKGEDVITEGECVPIDQNTGTLLPFQLISQRRGRKHELVSMIEEVPVALVMFDCLYLDGRDQTLEPYLSRRDHLRECFEGITEDLDPDTGISLSRMKIVTDPEEGEDFFIRALGDGCEGVMAKSVSESSIYRAGSRGWNWIKYKRDYRSELSDTLDLVVIGAFHGRGRRQGTYGALLMAAHDPKTGKFRSVCKLGSGFTDDHLKELIPMIDSATGPDHLVWKDVESRMEPDIRTRPEIVMEVLGAEITFSPMHTCSFDRFRKDSGLALRFPRFTGRFRDDKGPFDATTESEIETLYSMQNKLIPDG